MASSDIPWRQDGDNSWNELVDKVNEVLNDPPTGLCDPVEPLEKIEGECNEWKAEDINEMQVAIEATCDEISLERVEECDKWKLEYIEKIEEALEDAWCDCKDDCSYPCDNASTTINAFLGSVSTDGCINTDLIRDCSDASDLVSDAFSKFFVNNNIFNAAWEAFCVSQEKIDKLEKQIENLQTQRDSACEADAESNRCKELQSKVQEKEAELAEEIEKRDAQTPIITKASAQMDVAAGLSRAAYASTDNTGSSCNLAPGSYPWTNLFCGEKGIGTGCHGFGPGRCQVFWRFQRRQTFRRFCVGNINPICFDDFTIGGWSTRATGTWTPSGQNMVLSITGDCCVKEAFSCSSTSCDALSCPDDTITYEYRAEIDTPDDYTPFSCTGADCDENGPIEP